MSIYETDPGSFIRSDSLESSNTSGTRTLGLVAASIFIVYHVVGIAFVGPAADSYIRNKMWPYYETYLSALRIDGGWSFYAPDPSYGTIISYEAISEGGEKQIYPLSHKRPKIERGYFLYTNFFNYALNDPAEAAEKGYIDSMVRYLCDQNSDFPAHEITFIEQSQTAFRYTDYLNGHRPLDPEFLEETRHGPYTCGE